MTILKFTNVKYYIGGGKKPLRLRFNQNYTIVVQFKNQQYLLKYDNKTLINNLTNITNGRIASSSTTKLKRILK